MRLKYELVNMSNLTHLPVYTRVAIQSHGHLLISGLNKEIIAVSESVKKQLGFQDTIFLGTCLDCFINAYFDDASSELLRSINEVINFSSPRKLIIIEWQGTKYYVHIYVYNQQLYLEWEEQKSEFVLASEMNEIGFLYEQKKHDIWNYLCKSIHNIIGFSRIAVLRVPESGASKVISEIRDAGQDSILGQDFSNGFMDEKTIEYYNARPYIYCPDLTQKKQNLFAIRENIDLAACMLRPFPLSHQYYLQQNGVRSAIHFVITINDQFWGLVIAHHNNKKTIDLQKRKLCSFIVQNAADKYFGFIKQERLKHFEQLKKSEERLRVSLLEQKSIEAGLRRHMDVLCAGANADGIAVYMHGEISSRGLCPSESQICQIVSFFRNQPKRPLLKDHNFRLRHQQHIDGKLPFAGLAAICVGGQDDRIILWFKKETQSPITRIRTKTRQHGAIGFEFEQQKLIDTAIPWDENEITFMRSLDKLISDVIVSKSKEQERAGAELQVLNNELEMLTFTLSHDLKNPLSIVKMGSDILKTKKNMSPEFLSKWLTTINRGVKAIETLVDNTVELSKNRTLSYSKDLIPMSHTIRSLCQEAKLVHSKGNCTFLLGPLLPIFGEKSALYQIFMNVIGNAVKYSSEVQQPQVEIFSKKENGDTFYTIKDNGIGIPKNELKKIFEMFHRASNSSNFTGSGVGLCLVKRIVERLDGAISIDSDIGRGTAITLRFPNL